LATGRSGAGEPTGLATELPFVSIVLPARNEAAVIGSAVEALCGLRYHAADGSPRYETLVVDDGSRDATGRMAEAAATAAAGVAVRRREPGTGRATKGAVLAWAMPYLRGDVIGAVDADTRVEPAFLERAMRAWLRDPRAAALQVARRARNAEASWLTRAQDTEQLMDLTSQCGRWATDGTAELRGNGMFVRRAALEAVGGWNDRAMTEDLDLSTRLVAIGHHVALAPEAEVEEEAVERIGALWSQRLRWAEGSMRRLLEHGPGLLLGSQPWTRKADFLAFTAEFLVPPLFATTFVASLITIPLPRPADWSVPAALFVSYGLGIFFLALGGLWAVGARGLSLLGRAASGALFLSHWLIVVPVALVRIALGPEPRGFVQTPRFTGEVDR
jgi:1,2-diacylglycerol 3-beta-glucosyltransferase